MSWNRGNGTFDFLQLAMPNGYRYAWPGGPLGTGDIDGDGDTDLVVSQWNGIPGQETLVFKNQRSRQFVLDTSGAFPATAIRGTGAELFDADGDGDLDAVFWNYLGAYTQSSLGHLCLNDGTGRFRDVTSTHLPLILGAPTRACVVDFDRDGDSDMLWSVYGNWSMVMTNTGAGQFATTQLLTFPAGEHVTTGDINGDGYPDAFFSCRGETGHLLTYNPGMGQFVDASHLMPYGTMGTISATMVDIDGDTDTDIILGNRVVGNQRGGPQIWINQGQGQFQDLTSQMIRAGNEVEWGEVLVADFDRDGDLDLAGSAADVTLPYYIGGGRLMPGTLRHTWAPGHVARNRNFDIAMDARPGHLLVPLLGMPGAALLFPGIGPFGLDPARTVPLPPVQFPDSATRTVPIFVPDNPWLSGQVLRVQAVDLWVEGSQQRLHTTNWLPFQVL